jgi:hypothetical protein
MYQGNLSQIWLRLQTDSAFAARLRTDFAGALSSEGYLATLPIGDLPSVYRWHLRLQSPRGPRRNVVPITDHALSAGWVAARESPA